MATPLTLKKNVEVILSLYAGEDFEAKTFKG
jgi:hypothetical protein